MSACKFCLAAGIDDEWCQSHPTDETFQVLRSAFARMIQGTDATDEQIGWYLDDAVDIWSFFDDPRPTKWTFKNYTMLPDRGFIASFTLGRRKWVIPDDEGASPVPLTTWREWQREAEQS